MIEADFMREYGINLSFALDKMSWRRFLVLLYNLSSDSLVVNILNARRNGEVPLETNEISSTRILEQYFG